MFFTSRKKRIRLLVVALDKAIELLRSYNGGCGLSTSFDSTEEFAAALEKHRDRLIERDLSCLDELAVWFAPTSDWDDCVGEIELANEIEGLIKSLRKRIM